MKPGTIGMLMARAYERRRGAMAIHERLRDRTGGARTARWITCCPTSATASMRAGPISAHASRLTREGRT